MQLLGTEQKIMQFLGTKKTLNLLGPKKSHNLSGLKKSRNLLGQKKSRNLLGQKNVLTIQILVTIKIQEIGADHLGLVFFFLQLIASFTTQTIFPFSKKKALVIFPSADKSTVPRHQWCKGSNKKMGKVFQIPSHQCSS